MSATVLEHRTRVSASAQEAYAWHLRPGALRRLTPPWERVQVLEGEVPREGGRQVFRVRQGPTWVTWTAAFRDFVEGQQFVDVQLLGAFASWKHTRRFEPAGRGSVVHDRVEYALPLGRIGAAVAGGAVHRRLARSFRYREAVLAHDLDRHRRFPVLRRFAIAGASGFLGSNLEAFLTAGGHEVLRLVRRPPASEREVRWDPTRGQVDTAQLEEVDVVVHLAGESLAVGRWTARKKEAIRESRVHGTRVLSEALAGMGRPPSVLISASASGYYGDRGDTVLTETSEAGRGFLPEVCRAWEAATKPAEAAGIRVVHLRSGVVLSPAAGLLKPLLPIFSLGLGGRLGSGRQFVPWVAVDDVLGAIHHAASTEDLRGALNVCSPDPVRNAEFVRTLGRVLHRPARVPVPAGFLRAAFGEKASALLVSARETPAKLLTSGFEFAQPELEEALRQCLGRWESVPATEPPAKGK